MSRRRQLYNLIDNVDDRPEVANIVLVNIPAAILANTYAGGLCMIANAAFVGQYMQYRDEISLYNITDNS